MFGGGAYDAFDSLFELDSVKGHISAAAFADYPNVAADAQNVKKLASTRVRLLQFKHVADRYFNDLQSKPLLSA